MKQFENISNLFQKTLKKGFEITNQNVQKSLKKVTSQVEKNINLPVVDKFSAKN